MEQMLNAVKVLQALAEAVDEAGEHGAPSGVLYLAWMGRGGSFDSFLQAMEMLVEAGRITKRGDCYYGKRT